MQAWLKHTLLAFVSCCNRRIRSMIKPADFFEVHVPGGDLSRGARLEGGMGSVQTVTCPYGRPRGQHSGEVSWSRPIWDSWSQAAVAVICLLFLLLGDPGASRQSPWQRSLWDPTDDQPRSFQGRRRTASLCLWRCSISCTSKQLFENFERSCQDLAAELVDCRVAIPH